MGITIYHADCLQILPQLQTQCELIYIDPPFNTGQTRHLDTGLDYRDDFADYLGFLMPRIEASLQCLAANGSILIHLDHHEVHYVKVAMDALLGRKSFINEIIWAYDYGGRSKTRWPSKHDTILWYALNPKDYIFNYNAIDRMPYMAPGLVGPEKAALGKTPTDVWFSWIQPSSAQTESDVWWNTIVPTNGAERTGYPTQKPLAILNRLIKTHSNPGSTVLDFFAGSGTTGQACKDNGRNCILIDQSAQAIQVMKNRFST